MLERDLKAYIIVEVLDTDSTHIKYDDNLIPIADSQKNCKVKLLDSNTLKTRIVSIDFVLKNQRVINGVLNFPKDDDGYNRCILSVTSQTVIGLTKLLTYQGIVPFMSADKGFSIDEVKSNPEAGLFYTLSENIEDIIKLLLNNDSRIVINDGYVHLVFNDNGTHKAYRYTISDITTFTKLLTFNTNTNIFKRS